MNWSRNLLPQRETDHAAGIKVTDAFEPFSQRNDVFTRAFWDDAVRTTQTAGFFASYRMEAIPRRGDGFSQRDLALRNAAWLISDVMTNRFAPDGRREGFQAPISYDTPVADQQVTVEDPATWPAKSNKSRSFSALTSAASPI